ncbi:hypothetical protein [Nonomuraea sp. NEAU-A123]|uniref:hypothetical protein n=1 Tax=Nonomuraea sp. NEAU-A123 TaxID=2839649 RepID=UPI001BE489CA|nr:hypothetical protein [Nonomuraea sp. NEAU-A123]MBT2227072.1 hypothetical protein [Nonomuraea sp. NEAU-A123]
MTEVAPPPGALAMTGLRARARAARRTAIVPLSCSLALIAFSQSLAERAPAGKETLPLAVLALTLFLTALPALAVTQAVWGARMRAVRGREQELYASPPGTPLRTLSRLSVGAGWAVTLLLGCTVPRPFRESGLYGLAHALGQVTEGLALVGSAAGVCFAVWWASEAWGQSARAGRPGGSPGDPWDPDRLARRRKGTTLRASATLDAGAVLRASPGLQVGAVVAVGALVGARAHLWEPATVTLYALLAAVLVCGVVTGE